MAGPALQDLIPHNHCFGCGPDNGSGLRLKSYWTGDGPSVARFTPQAHHCAAPTHFVNGGILATLVDCHCVCTAMAAAYLDAGQAIGAAPHHYYATTRLEVVYQRPTPLESLLELSADLVSAADGTYVLSCFVAASGKVRIEAMVEAVEVPDSWMTAVPGAD